MTDLRTRRLAAGLSIRQLEQATGIHRARLSTFERGLSADERRRINAALRAAERGKGNVQQG